MKKILFSLFFLLFFVLKSSAMHIKGGEIYYQDLGPGAAPNTERYLITLRLFVICIGIQPGQLETTVSIGIFNSSDESQLAQSPYTFPVTSDVTISLTAPSPCIINPSPVCYRIRLFTATVQLPKTPSGYDIVFERCCRIDLISNINPNLNIGAAFTCHMHGTNDIGLTATNSSPQFLVKDTVLICQKAPFTLNFGATDADNDSLSYEFAPAYFGGSATTPVISNPVSPDDLGLVSYANTFSGTLPLGASVGLDPRTGVISGTAPAGGDYIVCVLLKEWRKGINISQHRKDFIVHVDDKCSFAAANLKPNYITCNGFNYTFKNESPPSPLIHTYFWDFGVLGSATDTSYQASPTFVFPDSGVYHVKLIINLGEECSDSATTIMKVYPGFFPAFNSKGTCLFVPIQFIDSTQSKYGYVSGWNWNFGDPESPQTDTSTLQNPTWKYGSIGTKNVQLIVANSKGCLDTVSQTVQVLDKPPITLAFQDTLICDIDSLTLLASGDGTFSWSPAYDILLSATNDPVVYPKTSTYYQVTLNQNGCINTDSVLVNVVDFVSLNPGNDTTICLGDTITLRPTGDGLYFKWSPPGDLSDPSAENPLASPKATTQYSVIASIGKCNTSGNLTVRTVPYPGSAAGSDTTICYGDTASLHGTAIGTRFTWNPTNTLSNPSLLNPTAFPLTTTAYTLAVYDTLGCPKPGISIISVIVEPQVRAFAGNDTSVVVGQPLQLSGAGAPNFLWSPPDFLDQDNIQNPQAVLTGNFSYVMKAYTAAGCFGLDTINIKVFKTAPDIFVPNAFTPGKNINNLFRPIPVGIASLEYFRVYNRYGQLVYSTSQMGVGWDGNLAGQPQQSGGYVWMAKGIDYTGKSIFRKGTMVLIR